MIDTPVVPATAALWRQEIEKHGRLCFIIATEPHLDHFGGGCYFPGTVVAHDDTRGRIAATERAEMEKMLTTVAPESLPLPAEFFFRPPTVTFSHNLTLYLGEHTFEIIHMPGHTTCQTVVYVPEEKVLFAADTVTNRTMPSLHEALPFEWLASLRKLAAFDIDVLVPGHGAVGKADLIAQMTVALEAAIDKVREAIGKGLSLAETKDSIFLFDNWRDFIAAPGLRRWLNRVNVGRLYAVLRENKEMR